MDDITTIGALRTAVQHFVTRRDWEKFHTPKNLAMSIAIESAEIMEHFQWLTLEESTAVMQEPTTRRAVADEVADVIIYCLSLANSANLDLSDAVIAKLAHNEDRFPIAQVRGHLG